MIATYRYEPESAIPPGWILEEHLEARRMSQAEFARRCGRSPKLISDIIAGKAAIHPKTALQFQRVLGVDARIWLGIDSDYRLYLEREAEARRAEEASEWASGFPINELVKRGLMTRPESSADRVAALLSFFRVASVEAWESRRQNMAVAYRHSASFESDEFALATWMRIGEIEAEKMECSEYNAARFRQALIRIRRITSLGTSAALDEAQQLCLESGVVLAVVKPLPKTALSGVSRWLSPRRALIQLSARHMSDDHLWFSLFHEAAHILLHSKKDVFIHDTKKSKNTELDAEADKWATNFLIPDDRWREFTESFHFNKAMITDFAEEQGIAPGIIVGRLQHERLLPWNTRLNVLKARLAWQAGHQ